MISPKRLGLIGILSLGIAGVLLTPGCRPRTNSDEVHVRLINAVSDVEALNVAVDGQRVWKRAVFRSNTGYQGIADGTYSVRVDSDSLGGILLTNRPMTFTKGHWYTIVAMGRTHDPQSPAQIQVLEDDGQSVVPISKSVLHLLDAAPDAGPVDLVVNNIVALRAVAYGQRSDALALDSGSYDIKVTPADSPDSLGDSVSLHLDAGHSYTLVAMGQVSSQTFHLEAYPDNP